MRRKESTSFTQALGKELKKAGYGFLAAIFVGLVFYFIAMPALKRLISQIGKQPVPTQTTK
ncbi:MAG: hypothetical protein L6437_01710 [Kiritimatiellae bacterium]|nr:hypothetical protein [Verrucomicrobiota bacterium]MBU4285629.1 hypothetical protein [Verrucomicrobiota bacterium]MBU4366832.1 hypothetical protein [Verrucomicrobiota bacterium]MCG2658947.1 hypothetical protein [Kiritimatiellia bacterium]